MNTKGNALQRLLREIKRRRVGKTSLLYIVFCWGILEAADVLLPSLGIENEAVSQWLLFAAFAGFPVVFAISWFYQVTPVGIVKTTAFVDKRVLNNIAPLNDRRHSSVSAYFREENESSQLHWYITAESGALVGMSYGVPGSLVFGRAPDCDLTLPTSGVSRHHARLIIRDDRLFIEDLDSANGCVVNGQLVEGEQLLQHGDEVLLQNNLFRVSENYAWSDGRASALSQTTYIRPAESKPPGSSGTS